MSVEHRQLLLAVILSVGVLFTWQLFFATPLPPQDAPEGQGPSLNSSETSLQPAATLKVANPSEEAREFQNFVIESEGREFEFRNDLTLLNAFSVGAKYPFDAIVGSPAPFNILVIDEKGEKHPLFLDKLTSDSPSTAFSGSSQEEKFFVGEDSRLHIYFSSRIDEMGRLNIELKSQTPYRYQFQLVSSPAQTETNLYRNFLLFSNDLETFTVGDTQEKSDALVKWFAIDFNYHLFSVLFSEREAVRYSVGTDALYLESSEAKNALSFSFVYTQKLYDDLVSLGDHLVTSVDFGVLSIICIPILRALQLFYEWIPNYGVAIILLTLLIRTIMFPLQYKSFKGMKRMQKIQPDIQKIREKYKTEPQRLQKETMDLFKREKVNPLGGCLPLLVQLPIFFAFFKVLNTSVELVGAPFIWWILDLSIKDPYYVFPVVMTLLMLLQQKLTPATTMDKTQKKIMLFMPLIFGFIMKDLSSGLVLYIIVSSLYGLGQQLLVQRMKD